MKMETEINDTSENTRTKNSSLLVTGLDGLRPFQEKLNDLQHVLDSLQDMGDRRTTRSALKLAQQVRNVEATVTMIGQVKAGKTSLVNAMAGWPDLLPADVNPWTSVVTSIHMNPTAYPQGNHSRFAFFDDEEWNRLMDRGGRIGELASRAGAEDELEKIRVQIEEMREKSRRRLGRKFELLLGQNHDYGYFDSDLIERYVCLGDDFEDDIDLANKQGRFADITKSANLFMHRPEVPVPFCIRDTPGVNDTFMMREQITIRAIRESRICVVVLSAHQALSTVDMALIRLISNVKSREVIIFVNRIDELPDPRQQIPEIRDSILHTLKTHHGPENPQIIFGSANWANSALSGTIGHLDQASSEALLNWAEGAMSVEPGSMTIDEMVWQLSGVPELYHAIAERIEEGVGQETLSRIARRAMNLANGVQAKKRMAIQTNPADASLHMPAADLDRAFQRISTEISGLLDEKFNHVLKDFYHRLDRAHRSFLDRATSALVTHLENYGDEAVWSYDPTGLRILLKSAYQVFGKKTQSACDETLAIAATRIAQLYGEAFSTDSMPMHIETPPPPRVSPPILLGQTIALDLKGNWWTRWWQRRRGYRAYAMDFAEMIQAETAPIINGLKDTHCKSVHDEGRALLQEFMNDQRSILINVAEQVQSGQAMPQLGDGTDPEVLEKTLETLNKFAA